MTSRRHDDRAEVAQVLARVRAGEPLLEVDLQAAIDAAPYHLQASRQVVDTIGEAPGGLLLVALVALAHEPVRALDLFKVHHDDGTGWRLLLPDTVIRYRVDPERRVVGLLAIDRGSSRPGGCPLWRRRR